MTRMPRVIVLLSAGILTCAGAVALAQSVLAQLGVKEQDAQRWVLQMINQGGPSQGGLGVLVRDASAAYKKLPAGARGPVTTQLYAWTKAYANTPAFKTAYGKHRTEITPQPRVHTGTVDDELKVKMADLKAQMDASLAALSQAGQSKEQIAATKKQQDESLAGIAAVYRTEIEQQRVKDKADYESGMKDWQMRYPADPLASVARILREFLATATDVDFAAKVNGPGEPGDELPVFTSPVIQKKPWQWRAAYEFGPEALAAARAARSVVAD